MRVISLKTAYLFLIFLTFLTSLTHAWTEPRQLTNDLPFSDPWAASSGRNLYVVGWTGGGQDFYFLRSWNSGLSWLEPMQPADTFFAGSGVVDIECTPDNLIHVVWEGWYEGGNRQQLFHQASSDNGLHWSNRHQVFNNSNLSLLYPRLTSKGDSLFLVYTNGGNMFFTSSFNNGVTWEQPRIVDTAQGMSNPPTLLYSQGRIHLIYQLNVSDGGIKVYYCRSNDLGLSWTPRVYLSSYEHGPPFYDSQAPSAYADGQGHIVAAWFDYQYGSGCGGLAGDILSRVSTDNGISWLPEGRLTFTHTGNNSSCLILGNVIYVAWMDGQPFGCDYPKIVMSHSIDWGYNWSLPEVITNDEATIERAPCLIYSFEHSDTLLHCFYVIDPPTHGYDLYYVRSLPFYSRTMEIPENSPVELDLKANPNIFYSHTVISYQNETGSETSIKIYNVLGQRVWSKQVRGKEGQVIWDGKTENGISLSTGVYFARVNGVDKTVAIKLVLLK